jgi:hypothetical protein
MSSELEIDKILTLSTAHISEETNRILTEDPDRFVFSVRANEYGYFLSTAAVGQQTNPEDIQAIMAFAVSHGCSYVNLDRDGSVVPGLKEYDW